ncbi:MAG: (Fe-S)-binding protein [Bacillus subtilis]|nr:(Fe-S)-binding protein [Bacillus subtilis]
MRDAQRCCGGGGSFSFYNYDLSKQISKRKVDNIEASGASVVVTGCPGCMLQIKDQLGQKKSGVKVKHTSFRWWTRRGRKKGASSGDPFG